MIKRGWPLLLLAALAAGFYAAGLQRFASFGAIGAQQAALQRFAEMQPVLAPLAFVALYAAAVTLSLPLGALLSVAGGALFGTIAGSAYVITGASIGAVLVFLIARSVFGGALARRAGPALDRLRPRLQRDGFSYLLALRLLPVVPFWLINIAAPLAGVRLAPFAAATVLGISPATIVYVSLGAGFGGALAAGQRPDLAVVFTPAILLPLLALALLALCPVAWRAWTRHG